MGPEDTAGVKVGCRMLRAVTLKEAHDTAGRSPVLYEIVKEEEAEAQASEIFNERASVMLV
jgi:ribosomal protein L7/L12